ncbi:putative late blight resistance protein -like protein R1B-14-like isoform X1 [Capsicum annuum]|uniref:DUF4216 domain-containing protein n=1 Tax=Capsicum annuum TaxID=4072 RepID=A0A2G2ZMS2_CAPAN|nr:putative late blight resistance protein -like protein R1B-14-like isoform X1 [Capsicum annuum]PHT83204.1 hypothetical protein T459_11647 [Capsicum annuum]
MNIRKELWLQHDGSNYTMSGACYNMSKEENKRLWELLRSVKFPDGYASNISGNDDGSSNNDGPILEIFSKCVRPYKDGDYDAIPKKDFDMTQWYMLNNCEEAEPFIEEHKEELLKQGVVDIEEKHREQFPSWFRRKTMQLFNKEKSRSIMKVYPFAMGPNVHGTKRTGCIVNGVRYHIQQRDELRKSQNCGIAIRGLHEKVDIDFYGIITYILKLEYVEENRVFLFKCKWFDLRKKIEMQEDKNFTSICVKRFWYEYDPFILATQEKQVFYINDPKLGEDWRIVLKFQARHIYDVPEKENLEVENDEFLVTNAEVYHDTSLESKSIVNDTVDILSQLYRDNVESITIGANVIELEAQTEYKVEVDYDEEDSDQEEDTMVEYISDHEDNEGNNSTTNNEVDSIDDNDDIDL